VPVNDIECPYKTKERGGCKPEPFCIVNFHPVVLKTQQKYTACYQYSRGVNNKRSRVIKNAPGNIKAYKLKHRAGDAAERAWYIKDIQKKARAGLMREKACM
jgi:hypothetical protein